MSYISLNLSTNSTWETPNPRRDTSIPGVSAILVAGSRVYGPRPYVWRGERLWVRSDRNIKLDTTVQLDGYVNFFNVLQDFTITYHQANQSEL